MIGAEVIHQGEVKPSLRKDFQQFQQSNLINDKTSERKQDKTKKKIENSHSDKIITTGFPKKQNKGYRPTSRITSKFLTLHPLIICPLLLTILFSLCTAEDSFGCFQCRILNRDWNDKVPENCYGTIRDCGNCTKGYYGDQDETCAPNLEIKNVINNDVVSASFGNAMLPCRLPERGDCLWKLNGHHLDINGHYIFLDQFHNGINTTDCSILIKNMDRSFEKGHYSCGAKPDSSGHPITSFQATLLEERAVVVAITDQMAHVTVGDTVVILCHLPTKAECVWRRGENVVQITNNYAYLHADDDHKDTTDCSIRIINFRAIDANAWRCNFLQKSSHNEIVSRTTLLKLVKPPSAIGSPRNASASIGGRVWLPCKFNSQVQCIWKHNGQEVAIKSRFRLSTNQSMGDCSIYIVNVTQHDAGSWACSYEGYQKDQNSNMVWLSVLEEIGNDFSQILPTYPVPADGPSEDSNTTTDVKVSGAEKTISAQAEIIIAILSCLVIFLLAGLVWMIRRSWNHQSYTPNRDPATDVQLIRV